jgi:RNA polymerase nonessential primary-like sigma factor
MTATLSKDSFFQAVGRFGVMPRAQEKIIAPRARAGDVAAREAMIHANLRLVLKVAKKYLNCGLPYDDLVQAGNLGLVRAAEKFDPDRGFRFNTYAWHCIEQNIQRALSECVGGVRVPEGTLRQTHGSDEVRRVRVMRSLDRPLVLGGTRTMADVLPDHRPGPEALAAHESRIAAIRTAVAALDSRRRFVIERRHGLDGAPRWKLSELAEVLRVSRERVRQLEFQAMAFLRKALQSSEPREATREAVPA